MVHWKAILGFGLGKSQVSVRNCSKPKQRDVDERTRQGKEGRTTSKIVLENQFDKIRVCP